MGGTRSAKLDSIFVGDGYYDLCLRIGELIQLQEKLGAGPFIVARRLHAGEWFVEDITETIRLALIGGGMGQREAFDLVRHNVCEGHLVDYSTVAAQAIYAALSGVEDEPIEGEAEAPMDPMMEGNSFDGEPTSGSEGPQDLPPLK